MSKTKQDPPVTERRLKRWPEMTSGERLTYTRRFVFETFQAAGGRMPTVTEQAEAAKKIARVMDRAWRGHVDGCRDCRAAERAALPRAARP